MSSPPTRAPPPSASRPSCAADLAEKQEDLEEYEKEQSIERQKEKLG